MKVGNVVEWKSVHYDNAKDAIHFLNEEYREDLLSVHFDYNKRDSTIVEFFYGDGHGEIRTVTLRVHLNWENQSVMKKNYINI